MQVLNIELEEKIPQIVSLIYRDETTNVPVDLTGYSAIIQVRGAFGSPYPLLELTDVSGDIDLGGINGTINIKFTEAMSDLSAQPFGWHKGVYDLVLIPPVGNKVKLTKGFITIIRSAVI